MISKTILIILPLILFFLNGCAGLSETAKVLRNEKVQTTDEFLIKKNEPLSQPPDFDKLIEPNSIKNKKTVKETDIKKILKVEDDSKVSGTSSTEESILKKINK